MEALIDVRLCQALGLQAKGSECSLTTRRRVAERASSFKRRSVRAVCSSSAPCVLNPSIEPNRQLFTMHNSGRRQSYSQLSAGSRTGLSSPPVNNFGSAISGPGAFMVLRALASLLASVVAKRWRVPCGASGSSQRDRPGLGGPGALAAPRTSEW